MSNRLWAILKECENTKIELKKQNRTRTKYNSRLKVSIQFTKPMQLESSQLQMMYNVKVHSNTLEKVQSNQISKLFGN